MISKTNYIMSKKIEIEVRILLKNRKEVEKALAQRGAILIKYLKVKDFWYCDKNAHTYKQASIDTSGFALRVREEKDLQFNKTSASIDCKTLQDGKNHAICNEYALPILNIPQAKKILESINLKEFLVVNKERKVYKYQGITFYFDKIKGVGDGLEIEVMATKGTEKIKYEQLLNLVDELNISKEEILEKSLTFIAMQNLANF